MGFRSSLAQLLVASRGLASSVLLLLLACGPSEPSPGSFQIGKIVLGGGHDDATPGFVELEPEDPIALLPGIQGGFHMYVNARLTELDGTPPSSLVFEREARSEASKELLSRGKQRIELVPGPAGSLETGRPQQLITCPTPAGVPAAGHLVLLSVAVSTADSNESLGSAELLVRPTCPTDALAAYCADICGT
ncbi:MAG: hypothetical protein HYV07_00300 [Deltaproteobacteria bacterium]|nr:hypothetical protein [Deltaproteobacteria bacterium]